MYKRFLWQGMHTRQFWSWDGLFRGGRVYQQHPLKRNDIVWECRMCQSDETCVFCHLCWEEEGHVGHDVTFYHAHAGGCCDCGDADG
jgi:hypothetical protein